MEEGVTVKFAMAMVLGALVHMMAEGGSVVEMHADALTRWPRDFNGMAVAPSHVRHVGYAASAQCGSVTGVLFPGSIEAIGQHAFMGCDRN